MDKYETGLRIQEIRNAYEDKNFIKAAELAKDVDWSKIKEWIPLAMMVDVQEQVGDLEEARDILLNEYGFWIADFTDLLRFSLSLEILSTLKSYLMNTLR